MCVKMLNERSNRRTLRLGHLMFLLGRWNTLMTDLPVRAAVARTGLPPPDRSAKFHTPGYCKLKPAGPNSQIINIT